MSYSKRSVVDIPGRFTSGERTKNRPIHGSETPKAQCQCAILVIRHIGNTSWSTGDHSSTEEASEESTDQNGFDILRQGDGQYEEGEQKDRNDVYGPAAIDLREGRQNNRSQCETKKICGQAEKNYL